MVKVSERTWYVVDSVGNEHVVIADYIDYGYTAHGLLRFRLNEVVEPVAEFFQPSAVSRLPAARPSKTHRYYNDIPR